MIVGLLDEPYNLTMEDVSKLTIRQINFLYYRERQKDGRPRVLPYYFQDKEENRKQQIEMFRAFGKSLQKTDEEIEQIIKEAEENGSII